MRIECPGVGSDDRAPIYAYMYAFQLAPREHFKVCETSVDHLYIRRMLQPRGTRAGRSRVGTSVFAGDPSKAALALSARHLISLLGGDSAEVECGRRSFVGAGTGEVSNVGEW